MVPDMPGERRGALLPFSHAGLSRARDAAGHPCAWLPGPVRLPASITDQGEKEVYVSGGHRTEDGRAKG